MRRALGRVHGGGQRGRALLLHADEQRLKLWRQREHLCCPFLLFVLPSTTGPCRRLHSTAQTQILRLGRTPLPSHSQTQTHNTIECSLPTHDAYQGSSEHSAPAKKTNPPRIRTRRPLRTPAATSSLPDATREAPQRPARLPPALSRPRPVSRPFLSSPIVCVATPARLGSGPAGSRPVTLPYLPRLSFSSAPENPVTPSHLSVNKPAKSAGASTIAVLAPAQSARRRPKSLLPISLDYSERIVSSTRLP